MQDINTLYNYDFTHVKKIKMTQVFFTFLQLFMTRNDNNIFVPNIDEALNFFGIPIEIDDDMNGLNYKIVNY